MRVLGWILEGIGALSALFGAGSAVAIVLGGTGVSFWSFLGLFFLSILPMAMGAGLFVWGRHFVRQAQREAAIRFERVLRELGQKSGGAFTLEQASREFGCTRDEAERLLRPMVARQVLEMDFQPDGEMAFKLTPIDEARARLGR